MVYTPGTPAEQSLIVKSSGATLVNNVRHAESGQFWVYGFAVAAGARCRLELTLEGDAATAPPNIEVLGADSKPLPIHTERNLEGDFTVEWTAPEKWPLGARQSVMISAKSGPVNVQRVQFTETLPSTHIAGLPDTVLQLMTQGLPPNTRPSVLPAPERPYTITQTGHPADPGLELQIDALFAYTNNAATIDGWKARGYTVWTMGGSRAGKDYAAAHPDAVQTGAHGKPIAIDDSFYLSPTADRIAIERSYYDTALVNGSEGVCPEEPEYWARAGYEGAFKAAWQRIYDTAWQDPAGSVDARWKAGQLMASLEADHNAAILQDAALRKPSARRLVALHSPINYAEWGIVSPQYRIMQNPLVQEVVGQVWTGTARTPARYAGVRADRTFSIAYLEYSSLYHLLRGTGKKLWFLMDPLEDAPGLPLADYKSHYEQTLVASLLFPGVDAYEVMPWPERVYGHIPADYAVEIDSVIAALQEMHTQTGEVSGNAAAEDTIGVFTSDSMQWQREAPDKSDFDGFFGLTLPLLERGVPVQVASLDRAAEPGYLRPFKTLLLSYDYQKPPDARAQAALAEWVRQGGSLLFFGGSDAYNAVAASWWRLAKLDTPQADLWSQLGLPLHGAAVTASAPAEDLSRYQVILKGDGAEHNLKNRRLYTLDLTKFAQPTGSVAVRFSDVTPQDGWGALVTSAELRIGGQLAAAFTAGSEVENRFLVYDNGSQLNGQGRFADGDASWTYEFDNLPPGAAITLTVDMGNGFEVSAASAQPDFGHTLLNAGTEEALAKALPRLRIGTAYPATLYPPMSDGRWAFRRFDVGEKSTAPQPKQAIHDGQKSEVAAPDAQRSTPNAESGASLIPLYNLRSGGTPVWMANVGRGLVLNVGIAPGFFSASERSAALLRALTQYAAQRAGSPYAEPGSLRLRRGRYTIIRTFREAEPVEGRTIDLLSPTLSVATHRTIPSDSLALLCDLDTNASRPSIAFVSGRVQARIETDAETAFFARGPLGTMGVARLYAGSRQLLGARGFDRLGRPVSLEAIQEGDTVLLRYPNDPDGIVVRAGWR